MLLSGTSFTDARWSAPKHLAISPGTLPHHMLRSAVVIAESTHYRQHSTAACMRKKARKSHCLSSNSIRAPPPSRTEVAKWEDSIGLGWTVHARNNATTIQYRPKETSGCQLSEGGNKIILHPSKPIQALELDAQGNGGVPIPGCIQETCWHSTKGYGMGLSRPCWWLDLLILVVFS